MTPIEAMLSRVEWQEIEDEMPEQDDVPIATHSGVLRIGEIELLCYQLSDGRRIITDDLARFLGFNLHEELEADVKSTMERMKQ